jgi:hypothetical protein
MQLRSFGRHRAAQRSANGIAALLMAGLRQIVRFVS